MRTIKLALLLSALSFLQVNANQKDQMSRGKNSEDVLVSSALTGFFGGVYFGSAMYAMKELSMGSLSKSVLGITSAILSLLIVCDCLTETNNDLNDLEWTKRTWIQRILDRLPLAVGLSGGIAGGFYATNMHLTMKELRDVSSILYNADL